MTSTTFFDTIDELIDIIPINSQNDLDKFNTALLQAQRKELQPLLGKDFLQTLLSKYSDNEQNAEIQEVISYCQLITGSIAVASSTFISNIDAQTFLTERAGDEHVAAKQWRVDDLREFLYNQGYNAIDDLLEVLEETDNQTLKDWKESEYFVQLKSSIIDNVNIFQNWENINRSRRVLLALRPVINYIEQFQIKMQFAPIYDKLREPDYIEVLTLLQAALVKATVAKAVDQNIINHTTNGLRVKIRRGHSQNNIVEADSISIAEKKKQALEEYSFLIESTLKELNSKASAEKYKEWFESAFYKPQTTSSYKHDCTDKIYMG